MLIIIEGVDCSGKSTLAASLQKVMGNNTALMHKGPPETSSYYEEYMHPLYDYEAGGGKNIICDRWHIGELVYGPIYRGNSMIDGGPALRSIENVLHARGAIMVHCDSDVNTIHNRLDSRGDDMIKKEDVASLLLIYRNIVYEHVSELPTLSVYLTDQDMFKTDLVSLIIGTARAFEYSAISRKRGAVQ